VAREAGFDVVFKIVAWKDIFSGLDSGSYDAVCSAVTITEQRMGQVDFSLPYFWDRHVHQVLLVRKNTPVKSLEELKGKVLGAQNGTTGYLAAMRMQSIDTKPYEEIDQAFRDLLAERIDGVICDDPVATRFMAQDPKSSDKLGIVILPDTKAEYYGVAVKKGNREVLDLVNKGIELIQAKGTDIELRKKWMGK
jgi:polar amino acid transport system substrate-binding protein